MNTLKGYKDYLLLDLRSDFGISGCTDYSTTYRWQSIWTPFHVLVSLLPFQLPGAFEKLLGWIILLE